jgi:hypothetical protein
MADKLDPEDRNRVLRWIRDGAPEAGTFRALFSSFFVLMGIGYLMALSATSAWAVELGVLIHLCLAVALGIGLAFGIRLILRRLETLRSQFAFTVLILTAVWAMNFLVVLPHINPAFVHLLPYSVTLLSKMLFGLAAATTFHARRAQRAATAVP